MCFRLESSCSRFVFVSRAVALDSFSFRGRLLSLRFHFESTCFRFVQLSPRIRIESKRSRLEFESIVVTLEPTSNREQVRSTWIRVESSCPRPGHYRSRRYLERAFGFFGQKAPQTPLWFFSSRQLFGLAERRTSANLPTCAKRKFANFPTCGRGH